MLFLSLQIHFFLFILPNKVSDIVLPLKTYSIPSYYVQVSSNQF